MLNKDYVGVDSEGRLIPTPGLQSGIIQSYRRAGVPFTPPGYWKLARKFMAMDAAPKDPADLDSLSIPDPGAFVADVKVDDPDPMVFFNGFPYAEGLRRFNEYKAKKGKK